MERRIEKEELHSIYYSRFDLFHNFLVKHNIKYYAMGGTLLGAIRHNGIIPWDDDMDIIMLREDYERFLLVANELDKDLFEVVNYRTRKYIEHPLTKIALVGVINKNATVGKKFDRHYHIDIFPVDCIYKNNKKQTKIIKSVKRLKMILYFKSRALSHPNIIKRLLTLMIKVFLIPISCKFACKKYDRIVQKANKTNNGNGDVLWTSGGIYSFERETHKLETYGVPTIHAFGTTSIFVPQNPNQFLIDTFGPNYMKPMKRGNEDSFYCVLTDDFVKTN